MVLGIGEGSIEIVLDEGQLFEPGKTVKGRLRLDLKEPKTAKKLRIEFYGEIIETEYDDGERHETTKKVYERSAVLGKEKEYPAGASEYKFEIELPQVKAKRPEDNLIGKIVGFIAPDPLLKAKWFLDASLELPMSFDINRKMQVDFRV